MSELSLVPQPKGIRRRRSIVLLMLAVAMVVVVSVRLLDRATPILYFRVIDDRTLVVGTVTGPGTWTRVTSVTETTSSVTVSVGSLTAPLPGYGGDLVELTVSLHDPIGERTMIDASSGIVVPRTRCLPPAYLAPGCT